MSCKSGSFRKSKRFRIEKYRKSIKKDENI